MLEITNSTLLYLNFFIFLIASILVLKKGRTKINLLFTSSTIIISLNSLLAGIAFDYLSLQPILFPISTAIFILTPLGFFFTGKVLRFGRSHWNDLDSLILIYITGTGSITSLIFYNTTEFQQNNFDSLYSDLIITIGLIFGLYQFLKVYLLINTKKWNFGFIISGFLITIIGLSINLIFLIFLGENTLLRFISPSIGSILVFLAFLKN